MIKVKICGLKRLEEIEIVNNFSISYIGFVFAPSRRRIDMQQAKVLKASLNPKIKSVGVFVNETIENILSYETAGVIDAIQLHGNENIVYMKTLKKSSSLPIFKAFRIKDLESLQRQQDLMMHPVIDEVLLDTYDASAYGGNGKQFDWQILKHMQRPYFLAGGISSKNIEAALSYKIYGIDVSSKVETDGIKDKSKVESLMRKIDNYEKNELISKNS